MNNVALFHWWRKRRLAAADDTTYHLVFDGVDDALEVAADASINDLPLADFTVEFVARFDGAGYVLLKGDTFIAVVGVEAPYLIRASIDFDDGDESIKRELEISLDATFRHYEWVWTQATNGMKVFVNGIEATYTLEENGTPTEYATDAGTALALFAGQGGFTNGDLRWLRISNNARHSSNFTPPSLTEAPATDANTVLLLALDEGTGQPLDTSGNENEVTLTGGTWVED